MSIALAADGTALPLRPKQASSRRKSRGNGPPASAVVHTPAGAAATLTTASAAAAAAATAAASSSSSSSPVAPYGRPLPPSLSRLASSSSSSSSSFNSSTFTAAARRNLPPLRLLTHDVRPPFPAHRYVNFSQPLLPLSPVSPQPPQYHSNPLRFPVRHDGDDLQVTSAVADFVSPIMSRAPSVASDRASTVSGLTQVNAANLSAVRPSPAYVAPASASQVVAEHRAKARRRPSTDGNDGDGGAARDDVSFSAPALCLVNYFLDHLLYSFLATARSTSLLALRPAVLDVLKGKLAKEAIASAEDELKELLGCGDDEDPAADAPAADPYSSRRWDLELVWKRTRLRIMVYTRLGEMEDDDEERYAHEEQLLLAGERRFSQATGLVSWAAAIFLTSVLEYVAEQTLQIAGDAAFFRAHRSTASVIPTIVAEDLDVEKVALNALVGRLWRTWRRNCRTPDLTLQSPASGTASVNRDGAWMVSSPVLTHDRAAGASSTHEGDDSWTGPSSRRPSPSPLPADFPEDGYPEHVMAANIPLPMKDARRDVQEIGRSSFDSYPTPQRHNFRSDVRPVTPRRSAESPRQAPSDGVSSTVKDSFRPAGGLPTPEGSESMFVRDELSTGDKQTVPGAEQRDETPPTPTETPFPLHDRSVTASPPRDIDIYEREDKFNAADMLEIKQRSIDASSLLALQKGYESLQASDGPDRQRADARASLQHGPPDRAYDVYVSDATAPPKEEQRQDEPQKEASVSDMRVSLYASNDNHAPSPLDSLVASSRQLSEGAITPQRPSEMGSSMDGNASPSDIEDGEQRSSAHDIEGKGSADEKTDRNGVDQNFDAIPGKEDRRDAAAAPSNGAERPIAPLIIAVGSSVVGSGASKLSRSAPVGPSTTADSDDLKGLAKSRSDQWEVIKDSTMRQTPSPIEPIQPENQTATHVKSDVQEQRGSFSDDQQPLLSRVSSDASEQKGTEDQARYYSPRPMQRHADIDDDLVNLTSANIRGLEDFDMFVPTEEVVKYNVTRESIADEQANHRASALLKLEGTHGASSLPPSPVEDARAGRSQRSRIATSAGENDDELDRKRKEQYRRSTSRPAVRNTSAHQKSGLLAREPRVQTSSTRDLADFLRSTGPAKEHDQPLSVLNGNHSTTQVNSSRRSSIISLSSRRARSQSPTAAGARGTTDNGLVPPVPPMPSQNGPSMKARDASGSSINNNDLIDFIRKGPTQDREHHSSRIVAPYRGTIDPDRFNGLGDSLTAKHLDLGPGTGQVSANSSSGNVSSRRNSANSRAPLLPGSSENVDVVSQPTYNGHAQIRSGSFQDDGSIQEPIRKRFRNKDPDALILDEEYDDELTALPWSQRKESLIDFLNNSEPPQEIDPRSTSLAPASRGKQRARSTNFTSFRSTGDVGGGRPRSVQNPGGPRPGHATPTASVQPGSPQKYSAVHAQSGKQIFSPAAAVPQMHSPTGRSSLPGISPLAGGPGEPAGTGAAFSERLEILSFTGPDPDGPDGGAPAPSVSRFDKTLVSSERRGSAPTSPKENKMFSLFSRGKTTNRRTWLDMP